jgi:hypothetical protein
VPPSLGGGGDRARLLLELVLLGDAVRRLEVPGRLGHEGRRQRLRLATA